MLTEKLNNLYSKYPISNLNLKMIQSNTQRHSRYIEILNKLASSVTLNDEHLFEIASSSYTSIYLEFDELGLTFDGIEKIKRQAKLNRLKGRIQLAKTTFERTENEYYMTKRKLKNCEIELKESGEELEKWNNVLINFENDWENTVV